MEVELHIHAVPEFERVARKIWPRRSMTSLFQEIAWHYYKSIPLGKGLYKLRLPVEGKGKSGGARVIYFNITKDKEILLLTAFQKAKIENLTKSQLAELAEIGKGLLDEGDWHDGSKSVQVVKARAKGSQGV